MKYYTGIGSRKTPADILSLMTTYAQKLSPFYRLRSGGADGADAAFEKGAGQNKDIFLPWKNFNKNPSHLHYIPEEAYSIALSVHPYFSECKSGVKKLLARDVLQVLGEDLKTPSEFVLCWTPFAQSYGGTALAINVAKKNNIPVFNLWSKKSRKKFLDFL